MIQNRLPRIIGTLDDTSQCREPVFLWALIVFIDYTTHLYIVTIFFQCVVQVLSRTNAEQPKSSSVLYNCIEWVIIPFLVITIERDILKWHEAGIQFSLKFQTRRLLIIFLVRSQKRQMLISYFSSVAS